MEENGTNNTLLSRLQFAPESGLRQLSLHVDASSWHGGGIATDAAVAIKRGGASLGLPSVPATRTRHAVMRTNRMFAGLVASVGQWMVFARFQSLSPLLLAFC